MKNLGLILILFSQLLVSCQNQDDFTSLFNGKDLTGWVVKDGNAPFTVKDGMIIGTCTKGTLSTFLCTKETYGDFILTFEAKIEKGNSGVMFRAQANPESQDESVYGYQMELDPSKRSWTGGIYDEGRRGWLYCMEYNQDVKSEYKQGAWNKYRIEAISNNFRTYVNGVQFADLIDDIDSEGFIGLQVHNIEGHEDLAGQKSMFRNIKICTTNLDEHRVSAQPDIPQVSYLTNQLSEREINEGWKLLWDGQTTAGWRGAQLERFLEKGWKIDKGVLSVEKTDGIDSFRGGDIVTVDKYENFILEVDFKITEGADSGIKYFVDTELNSGSCASVGCEYQILDDRLNPDATMGKDGNKTLASLYDLITANAQNFNPNLPYQKRLNEYEWNRAKIIVHGEDVEHYLNGILVVKYNRSGQHWRDMVAESKYALCPNFGEARTGHILLQNGGDEVSFKNIKVKSL